MGLNQIIAKPLTLYTGSIVSHVVPDNTETTMIMLSSSLPPYNASPYTYRINQNPIIQLSTTAANISELQATLANNSRYLVTAYILVGSTFNTNGVRVGFSATNATTNIYNIETPDSTTSVALGVNSTPATLNSPSSTASNVYCAIIRAMVVTAPTGTPIIAPTIATEQNLITVVVAGSFLYYDLY